MQNKQSPTPQTDDWKNIHCSGCTDPDPLGGTHCYGNIEHGPEPKGKTIRFGKGGVYEGNLKVSQQVPTPQTWEERFNEIMIEWIETQWQIESKHQEGEPYTRLKFEAESIKIENKLKSLFSQELTKAAKGMEEMKNKISNPPPQSDWEDSFDKEFSNVAWHPENKRRLVSYISSLLTKAVEGERERIKVAVERMKSDELSVKPSDDLEKTAEWYKISALDQILELLSPSTIVQEVVDPFDNYTPLSHQK